GGWQGGKGGGRGAGSRLARDRVTRGMERGGAAEAPPAADPPLELHTPPMSTSTARSAPGRSEKLVRSHRMRARPVICSVAPEAKFTKTRPTQGSFEMLPSVWNMLLPA